MRSSRLLAILFAHVLFSTASAQDASGPAGLARLLDAELARWPATTGVYVKNLASGETAAVRGETHFESASTIKVGLMAFAYRLAEQKQLDLDSRYEIKAADFRGGSGIFKYNDVGLKPTLRDVITQMISTSDNTATDIMVAKVGGTQRLNEFLRQSGYATLTMNRSTNDYFKERYEALDPAHRSLSPEQVFALTTDRPEFLSKYSALIAQVKDETARASGEVRQRLDTAWANEPQWFGIATPTQMGRLLESIERCTGFAQASCAEMRHMLRTQQVRHKIPHYLSVPVGNKTGDTRGVTNDIAIVYAQSGPIVIASYSMNVVGPIAEHDDRIGRLAQRVVDYFDGVRP
jgi:beta-lactamase class A